MFACCSRTFWGNTQNENDICKGVSPGSNMELCSQRLGRQVTLALRNIIGSCANPNHLDTLGKHRQRCLLSTDAEMASLIEERIGKVAAETSPLLLQLKG